MQIVVFDLGGTLMQYVGMPHSWVDFYEQGLEAIVKKYACNVSEEEIEQTLQILKDFNPRVNYREVEYKAEQIFAKALERWNLNVTIAECMETFWSGLQLTAEIYPETIAVLKKLRKEGYAIATLTDLPSAMPDEVFRKDITELLGYFDLYISSEIAGYRKPNMQGLQMIAEYFGVSVTELIFVGDEEKDRQAAKNANCRFVHILRTAKSTDGIGDLYELLDLLQG